MRTSYAMYAILYNTPVNFGVFPQTSYNLQEPRVTSISPTIPYLQLISIHASQNVKHTLAVDLSFTMALIRGGRTDTGIEWECLSSAPRPATEYPVVGPRCPVYERHSSWRYTCNLECCQILRGTGRLFRFILRLDKVHLANFPWFPSIDSAWPRNLEMPLKQSWR